MKNLRGHKSGEEKKKTQNNKDKIMTEDTINPAATA